MRFYHNSGLNFTADERWLVEYLRENEAGYDDATDDEIIDELRTRHEVYGWYECQVSNTIEEGMTYGTRI